MLFLNRVYVGGNSMEIYYILDKYARRLLIFQFFFQVRCLIKFLNYRETRSLSRAIIFRPRTLISCSIARIRRKNMTFPLLEFSRQLSRASLESCTIKVTREYILYVYLSVVDVRQLYAAEVPVLHADIPHKYSPCTCAPYIRDWE